jgi:WD40 repeat protein
MTLKGHTAPVVGVTFSPDGQWLVSSSFDTTIKNLGASHGSLPSDLAGTSAECLANGF